MDTAAARLTVFFEEPFWVGVYEREANGRYEVCKITFGAEPKDYEVYDFLLTHWGRLNFSPSIRSSMPAEQKVNPKRMQRSIKRQLQTAGIGTKAQQALKLQQEQGKQERHIRTREEREAEKARRLALHQAKQREKHRGH